MGKRFYFIFLFVFIHSFSFLQARVWLPAFFGDNMILQRDAPLNIWGWTDKAGEIEIQLNGQKYKTSAKKDGSWSIILPAMRYGGPHTMIIKGDSYSIKIENILIGDIWLCSGQSNMELPVRLSNNAQEEIENASYPNIRLLSVPKNIGVTPQSDFDAVWEVCSPETVEDFSAVGYYYARELHSVENIPIGIINASWGGTNIESWISPEVYTNLPRNVKKLYNDDIRSNFGRSVDDFDTRRKSFHTAMKNDIGLKQGWSSPAFDTSSWNEIYIPSKWIETPLALMEGYVWFKYTITLSANDAGKAAILSLGDIEDEDITWINGQQVGTTDIEYSSRLYVIPSGILRIGENDITIRVTNYGSGGGVQSSEDDLFIELIGEYSSPKISLAGKWKYKESISRFDVSSVKPNMICSSLYNGMIHPLTRLSLKGVIWYQGENNASAAYNYRILFPALINDWRNQWGYEFPFYWVQLANFNKRDKIPRESNWAELREAQTMTLNLPKTGQAVIYDIGSPYDIHPLNKQDVGHRLSLIALNKDYGKKVLVYSGPTFRSMVVKDNRAVVTMETYGSELIVENKSGYLGGFSIAGADKVFEWAHAYIDGNNVVIYSDSVPEPISVRYGWADNPSGNLYNKEGLPATPFRTDNWKGITEE